VQTNGQAGQALGQDVLPAATEQPADAGTLWTLVLADECLLYTRTRNYCGNVSSPPFESIHALLTQHYDELGEIIDEVAERVRAAGGSARGTMAEFLRHTCVQEQPLERPVLARMLDQLLEGHATLIRSLRGDLLAGAEEPADAGARDFRADLITRHERMTRQLRAQLANT
jgi:starvation-inducible DNA-binding protein